MAERIAVSEVSCVAAPSHLVKTGLLAFVSFRVGPIRVDGATLRLTTTGRRTISLPCRTDSSGRRHPIVDAASSAARVFLETELLRALGFKSEEEAPS